MIDSVGFWRRLIANLLDGIIISIPVSILTTFFVDWNSDDTVSIVQSLYLLILPVLWYGYTLGKRIMGIRIVRLDGKKVGIGTMLLRNLIGGLIYVVTLGIGLLVSAFMVGLRGDHRAIHDFIAGTYVSEDKPQ